MSLFSTAKNQYRPVKKKSKTFEIIEHSKAMITPAIDVYVNSLEMAASRQIQNRVPLYDQYLQTLMIDDIVASLLEKRLDNITNKQIRCYTKDGEPVDSINAFLESPRFIDFLQDLVMVQFWGYSVFEMEAVEWEDIKIFDYNKLPIKHINPYKKEVLKYQYDENGVPFDKIPDVLMLGDPDDLGLLSKITYLSILNRLGTFNWSNYSDLASNNFLMIKSRVFSDDEEIERMQLDYMKSGKKGVMAFPDGTDYELENQTSTSQNELFKSYYDMVRERLAVLILGNTMSSVDGSSYSQGMVHQSEQGKKYSADEVYVENVMNYEFKDHLNLWFSDIKTENLIFRFVPASDDEIREKLDNFQRLKDLGVIFTDEELRQHFADLIK